MTVNKMELITTLATVVLAVLTGFYVWLTYRLLKSTERPEVAIFLKLERFLEHGRNYVERCLCVQNVGTRAARDIRFEGNFSFVPLEGIPLNNINFLKNGINVLVPKQNVFHRISIRKQLMENLNDLVYGDENSKVEINVKYKSFSKKEYKDSFTLDFRELNYYSDQQSDNQ